MYDTEYIYIVNTEDAGKTLLKSALTITNIYELCWGNIYVIKKYICSGTLSPGCNSIDFQGKSDCKSGCPIG